MILYEIYDIYEIFAEYFDALEGRLEDLTDAELGISDRADPCWSLGNPVIDLDQLDPDWTLEIANWRDVELFLDLTGNLDAPL